MTSPTTVPLHAGNGVRHLLRVAGLALILASLLLPFAATALAQEEPAGEVVYAVEITGTIDLGLAPYLERVIDEAEDDPAAGGVLIEINTPGGRLDAALQMRQSILDSDVLTIAFVNREAFSAGALIAIAADEIYMAPGGVMGAATPVTGAGETASEKTISAVRSTFASTAEERGRDPQIAEAMVDEDIAIEGLTTSGDLLTLTTEEALEWGYAEGVADSREDVLAQAGLGGATIIERSPGLAERLVRFISEPVVASLLFSIGVLLIIGDLLVGGVGLVAAVGVGMLALVFWGHFIAGLAGWEGVALAVLGIALIAVEVLVVPGLGVAGILGTISLLAGLYLTVAGQDITTEADTRRALTATGIAFAVLVGGAIAALFVLPQAARFRGIALETRLSRDEQGGHTGDDAGWQKTDEQANARAGNEVNALETFGNLLGTSGIAQSDLRPGGIAEIDGERIDVVSEGGYITAGTTVIVVKDEGYRRVVRAVDNSGWQQNDES